MTNIIMYKMKKFLNERNIILDLNQDIFKLFNDGIYYKIIKIDSNKEIVSVIIDEIIKIKTTPKPKEKQKINWEEEPLPGMKLVKTKKVDYE